MSLITNYLIGAFNMYSPNFNDPRVQRRVKKAIGFTNALLADKPKQLYTRFIDKHFGCQRNELSTYLRKHLLICVDNHFDMKNGLCKMYIRNKRGILFLNERIDTNTIAYSTTSVVDLQQLGLNWATEQYGLEVDSGVFNYEERSHRLCSPIQSIRTQLREEMFANSGYHYNYDISTAAPTILYQYSFQTPSATGEVLPYIEDYLNNKTQRRKELALASSLDEVTVKKIFNGLFNGAKLSIHSSTQLFRLIGFDIGKMRYLQQDAYLIALKADIKTMWDTIKLDEPKRYFKDKFKKDGTPRLIPFNSKNKWNIYFKLERKVLNEMRSYLNIIGGRYFLEHDGFRTTHKIDTVDLSRWINAGTGFNLTLMEIHYTSSSIHSIVSINQKNIKQTTNQSKKTQLNNNKETTQ
jgi:hypothetical protein|tara:strand:- start:449 stop:1675 length:1227 start_codon:yes stop_codon:yes gene_type:complete